MGFHCHGSPDMSQSRYNLGLEVGPIASLTVECWDLICGFTDRLNETMVGFHRGKWWFNQLQWGFHVDITWYNQHEPTKWWFIGRHGTTSGFRTFSWEFHRSNGRGHSAQMLMRNLSIRMTMITRMYKRVSIRHPLRGVTIRHPLIFKVPN